MTTLSNEVQLLFLTRTPKIEPHKRALAIEF